MKGRRCNGGGFEDCEVGVRTWVCIRVLTTSVVQHNQFNPLIAEQSRVIYEPKGQVMVPANPPAIAPVAISNDNPISLPPTHSFAHF